MIHNIFLIFKMININFNNRINLIKNDIYKNHTNNHHYIV